MPDVKSIDSLSLKITSSTEEAVKALNSLENALIGVINATGGLKTASSNVDAFAKSMSGLASGLKSAITASKNMTFTQAEAEARELDKTINKVSKSSLAAFGVTNKKAIGDYRKALSDMANEYRRTDDFDTSRIAEQAKLLEDNSNFTKKAVDNYGEFKRYIDKLIADGNKVHRAFSFEDIGAGTDVKNAKSILGRLLTTGEASTDFEEWATQLQGDFQNIKIVGGTVSETLNNIAAAYDEGRGKAIKYADALKLPDSEGGLSGVTSFTAAMNDTDEVLKKVSEFQKATKVGDENNNVFRSMANSVSELNGVDFERVQALAGAMQPFASIDAGALSLAAKSISQLGDSLGKIALPEGGSNVGEFIKSLHTPLKMFAGLELPDFKPLLTLQKALSGFNEESYTIAATNLSAMAPTIKAFADQMREIKADGMEPLNDLIKSVTKFGHANMNKAIANIPTLASALRGLVDELNQLPEVSDKTLRLVEALGTLRTLNVGKAFDSAGKGADNYGKSAHRASGHTNGLLGVFMKARALLWGLRRAFDALKGSIDLASDLIEVQNVVDVTFGSYQEHLESIAKNSIEAFGTSELTFKSVASQFQAMGSAMGIGNSQIREATENLKGMGVAYGETTGQMGDMATTLTELAADMASFYNKDIKDVQTALTSVYTGQTRPMRQFGVDLTQANLKEWALTQGLNANIESMTQAEKTMLRYQYVLAHTGAAQRDFLRTQDSWHNSTVILKEEFKALGVVIGTGLINALKPFVTAMNATMKNVIDFAQNVVNALGQIFGWEMEITGGGLTSDYFDDIADAATTAGDGLSNGVGDAAKSAKELKDILLGIDELNVINQDTASPSGGSGGSGKGGGGSGGVGAGGASNPISASLKRKKALYESDIKNLFDLGTYISTSLRDTLRNIDWDSIYQGASDFGKGLASFLNGLIRPDTFGEIGSTLAKTLNTVIFGANGFLREFDGKNFGLSIAAAINGFFRNFNFMEFADTFLLFGQGLWDAIVAGILHVDYGNILLQLSGFIAKVAMGLVSGIAHAAADGLRAIEGKFGIEGAFSGWIKKLDGLNDYIDDFLIPGIERTVKGYYKDSERDAKKHTKELEKSWDETAGKISASTKKSFDANIKAVHDYRQAVARESEGAKSDWEKNNKLSVTISYPNVSADAQARMNEIKSYWEKNKKLPNLEVMYNDFSGKFKVTVQDLQNWFNNHRHMGKIVVETPQTSVTGDANGWRFRTQYVPTAYASGGYPTTGELFYAGEHGIAEIAGAINGRTAVAGGAEITGIKKAVEAETAVLSSLLNRIAAINTRIADKPTEVSINGRSLNKSLDRQRSRAGYSFT